MANAMNIAGILGGVAVVAALAAGGTVYLLRQPPAGVTPAAVAPAVSTPVPAQPVPAAPAPGAAAFTTPPPASAPAPATMAAVPDAAPVQGPPAFSVEFVSLVQPFSVLRDSAAYVAASPDAPQMYPLRAGAALMSTEKSKDGKWVVALTEDGQAAYLPTADLGPYNPAMTVQSELPASVTGPASVVDTGTLQVGDQKVALAGVKGVSGEYAYDLQKLINAQGPQVSCGLRGQAYLCMLPTGLDIARAALFNGAADVTDDASEDYRQQVASARAGHRGIWK
jgi:hypothetical protein